MKPAATLLTSIFVGSALLGEGVFAAEWQREAGMSLGGYVSDNICLSDRDEQTRAVGTVTPDVYLRGQGARANLYLQAALEYNTLGESNIDCSGSQSGQLSNRESLIPSLRYRGDLELIDNWLTLESDAFIGRNPIDPFAPGETDTFNGRENINITYHYGVGAMIQRRLFDTADMRLRYRYSEQYNEVNMLGDSSEDQVEFDLGTGRNSNLLNVGIAGRYSKVMYEESNVNPAFDNTLSSAEFRVALQPGPVWQLNGLVGEEWNEFTSRRPDIDGSYWDAGLRWTPNERIEVGVGTGERFFGTTPRMHIRYRHKRAEMTASYARSLTFPRDLRAADSPPDDPLDPDTGMGPDPGQLPGEPPTVSGRRTFIGNTPIIDERLQLRYRFIGRRTTIVVTASSSEQVRTEDLGEATFTDLSAIFSRSLSATLAAHIHFGWGEREGQGGNVSVFGRHSENWRGGLGLSRRLGTNTRVSMGYQYTRQESDSDFNRYNENRVTLSVRHQF